MVFASFPSRASLLAGSILRSRRAAPAAGASVRCRLLSNNPSKIATQEDIAQRISVLHGNMRRFQGALKDDDQAFWAYWALYSPIVLALAIGLVINYRSIVSVGPAAAGENTDSGAMSSIGDKVKRFTTSVSDKTRALIGKATPDKEN